MEKRMLIFPLSLQEPEGNVETQVTHYICGYYRYFLIHGASDTKAELYQALRMLSSAEWQQHHQLLLQIEPNPVEFGLLVVLFGLYALCLFVVLMVILRNTMFLLVGGVGIFLWTGLLALVYGNMERQKNYTSLYLSLLEELVASQEVQ